MKKLLRKFIDLNVELSQMFDRMLPARLRQNGQEVFQKEILSRAFHRGDTVYELGGGSRPYVGAELKRSLGLKICGLDISADELTAAPEGIYDSIVTTDVCTFVGRADANVVICQAMLEHVHDTPGTMRAISTVLRPGGRAFLFAPSRNAVFARMNMLLPQGLKQRLLFALFPHKAEGHDGFRAFYDHCTPSQIEALAGANGLAVEERRLFWISSYFKIFLPAFILWRGFQGLAYLILRNDAAETFAYVLKKP